MPEPESLLSVAQVSKICKVDDRTITEWMSVGLEGIKLAFVWIGRRRRIARIWLTNFLLAVEKSVTEKHKDSP